jgi:DNA helicase-2/ATP-dependent DNA helicase PcrA
MDEESEAVNVLHAVTALVADGHKLKDIAILYRTNAQSRSLEDVLRLGSTPYQIIGSVRFYERAEVRDILAYCKLLVNPADDVSLRRIINVPKRGLGKTTYETLATTALSRGVSVIEVLRSGAFDLSSAQIKRCAEFLHLFEKLEKAAATEDAPNVIKHIIDETHYRDHLQNSYPDAESRNENVDEVVTAAEVYTENSEDRSLRAFLEEIALVADIDDLDSTGGQLTLMTLHNAKGLEFDCVIVAGLEEGLFPHFNSLDKPDSIEEERRLFYVGMTRARKKLICSYANMRRRMGVIEGSTPSRFLQELPEELLEGSVGGGLAQDEQEEFDFDQESPAYASVEHDEYSQEERSYAVGMRIHHNDFGRGVVRKIEGSGGNLRVTVIFDGGGERKFIAQYAPMRPI